MLRWAAHVSGIVQPQGKDASKKKWLEYQFKSGIYENKKTTKKAQEAQ